MSTLVELAGFVCAIVAATLLGGPAAGWATAAGCLLLTGYALEGSHIDLQGARRRQHERWLHRRQRFAAWRSWRRDQKKS
jgi:hypothetical protein